MFGWLDQIPTVPLAISAIALGLSPPFAEPHLWQRLKQLFGGALNQPIDVGDFTLHISLLILLVLKLVRRLPRTRSW